MFSSRSARSADSPASLSRLPDEVSLHILSYLNKVIDLGRLARTCQAWNRLTVRKLYEVDAEQDDGKSIIWAIENKRAEPIQRALALGIDIFQIKHLCLAAEANDLSTVQAILTSKRIRRTLLNPVDVKRVPETTPLLAAVGSGNADIVRLLLDNGARVDERQYPSRERYYRPLEIAVRLDHTAVVYVLLEYGARATIAMQRFALRHCLLETAFALCKQETHETHPYGKLLEIAVRQKQAVVLEKLIRAGGDPNHTDPSGQSLLRLAFRSGHVQGYRILRAYGAHAGEHAQGWEETLLCEQQRALQMRRNDSEEWAYHNWCHRYRNSWKRGVSLRHELYPESESSDATSDSTDDLPSDHHNGDTILHHLARNSDCSSLRVALGQELDVDSRNDNGWTPLMVACLIGAPKVIQILLDHGADPNCAIHEQFKIGTVFHIALYTRVPRPVLMMLLRAGMDFSDPRGLYSRKVEKRLRSCLADLAYKQKHGYKAVGDS